MGYHKSTPAEVRRNIMKFVVETESILRRRPGKGPLGRALDERTNALVAIMRHKADIGLPVPEAMHTRLASACEQVRTLMPKQH